MAIIDDVKALGGDLVADFSDETINSLVQNAHLIAVGDKFPADVKLDGVPVLDMATKYMALHLAYTMGESGQGITMEKLDVLQVEYSDMTNVGWFNRSPWGLLYRHLYLLYGGGSSTRIAVIQH